MGGMETLREITKRHRLPVIVVSAHSTEGASSTFKALSLGAFDFVAKPKEAASAHMEAIATELINKIKVAAQTKVPNGALSMTQLQTRKSPQKDTRTAQHAATKIVAIGVSTGGPNAVQYVLSQLPADFPGSIVIVQHMPEGFTEMFAHRLNESCAIEVKEAQSGDLLLAGRALICPGNRHIKVRRMPLGNIAVLSDEDKMNGHRPSVDVLFRSVANDFGPQSMAVLMTGMGEDRAEGMGMIKAAGGITIAQSESSCVVYGMPKAAIERGYAMRVVPLDAMANTIQAQCACENSTARATRN
jgi:two-component system chemotaxis response regulator CheB